MNMLLKIYFNPSILLIGDSLLDYRYVHTYFLDMASTASRLDPDKIAVIDYSWGSREQYTYLDMNRFSENIAIMLDRLGINKGDRVSVLSYNNVEYLATYLAMPKKGAILAPLSWRASYRELAFMIDDVEPKVVIVHSDFQDLLNKALEISRHKPRIVNIEELRGLHREEPVGPYRRASVGETDINMLLYTGGTTGGLKAAMIPYRQVIWNAFNTIISWGLGPSDIAPIFFPFFHTGGWHVTTIPLYIVRGTTVLTKRFDPDEAIEIIERERCTVVIAVPTMFHLISKSPRFKESSFKSVRFFKSGGGMSPHSLVKIYWDKGVKYFQGYGLTEAGPNLLYTPEKDMLNKPMSVGKPGFFVEIRVVRDDGSDAQPGEVGELLVRGPLVFSGYWRRSEETARVFTPDGWLRTGDLFTVDKDGHLYFVERKKFMIKSGGENIYPSEVEEALRSHPGVEDAAVFGIPDPKWGEAVAAVVKPREGIHIDPDSIREYLRGKIARYKIPKYIWVVDEIPKTAVGKTDYMCLKKKYGDATQNV